MQESSERNLITTPYFFCLKEILSDFQSINKRESKSTHFKVGGKKFENTMVRSFSPIVPVTLLPLFTLCELSHLF